MAAKRRSIDFFRILLVAQGAGIGLAPTLPALNWLVAQYSWHWAFGALGIAGLVWPMAWLLLGAEGKLDQTAPAAIPSLAASFQPPRFPYRRLLFNGTVLAAYFAAFTQKRMRRDAVALRAA